VASTNESHSSDKELARRVEVFGERLLVRHHIKGEINAGYIEKQLKWL
jgi:hypothetical protein